MRISDWSSYVCSSDLGHRRTLQRRQQHAANRIAEGKAEAALERLGDDLGDPVRVRSRLDVQLRRLDQFGPVLLQHACALTTFGWFGVGFDGDAPTVGHNDEMAGRSEEHTSELQSLMRIS